MRPQRALNYIAQQQSRRQKGRGRARRGSTCGEEETQEGGLVAEPSVLSQIAAFVSLPGLLSPERVCLQAALGPEAPDLMEMSRERRNNKPFTGKAVTKGAATWLLSSLK